LKGWETFWPEEGGFRDGKHWWGGFAPQAGELSEAQETKDQGEKKPKRKGQERFLKKEFGGSFRGRKRWLRSSDSSPCPQKKTWKGPQGGKKKEAGVTPRMFSRKKGGALPLAAKKLTMSQGEETSKRGGKRDPVKTRNAHDVRLGGSICSGKGGIGRVRKREELRLPKERHSRNEVLYTVRPGEKSGRYKKPEGELLRGWFRAGRESVDRLPTSTEKGPEPACSKTR